MIESDVAWMTTEGLYRRNGNMATIQKLRYDIDQEVYTNLEKEKNVHVLTGTIKLFFR